MTADGLVKIQYRLEAIEQDNKSQPQGSTLLNTRQERRENVIMIIDGDVSTRALVRKTFEKQGGVIEFQDTTQVLEAYLEHLPDIVFMYIRLPNGSGITLLEEILGFDETAYIVIPSAPTA